MHPIAVVVVTVGVIVAVLALAGQWARWQEAKIRAEEARRAAEDAREASRQAWGARTVERAPMSPEVTRTAPVVDLAAHREAKRARAAVAWLDGQIGAAGGAPAGAPVGPAGPLGRITKDASPDERTTALVEAYSHAVQRTAAHLTAATRAARHGRQWDAAALDCALALVAVGEAGRIAATLAERSRPTDA